MPTSVEMGLGSAMFFLENILASSANVSRAVGDDVISMPGPCSGDIRRHHPEVFDGLPGTVASAATYRNSLPGSIGVKMQLQSDGGISLAKKSGLTQHEPTNGKIGNDSHPWARVYSNKTIISTQKRVLPPISTSIPTTPPSKNNQAARIRRKLCGFLSLRRAGRLLYRSSTVTSSRQAHAPGVRSDTGMAGPEVTYRPPGSFAQPHLLAAGLGPWRSRKVTFLETEWDQTWLFNLKIISIHIQYGSI